MALSDVKFTVPPIETDRKNWFWDDMGRRIGEIHVYPSVMKASVTDAAHAYFKWLREKGGYAGITREDIPEALELLKLFQTQRSYLWSSFPKKEISFSTEIMDPHLCMIHYMQSKFYWEKTYIGDVYSLYIFLSGYFKEITVLQGFSKNGEIRIKLGRDMGVYRIRWNFTYYGLPIRREEYITIENTSFCQDVCELEWGETLLKFLDMHHHHHLHLEVLRECMEKAHSPQRLEKHFREGGTIDTWDDVMGDAVINPTDWCRVYFHNKIHTPWTEKQRQEYCRRGR